MNRTDIRCTMSDRIAGFFIGILTTGVIVWLILDSFAHWIAP